MTASHGPRGNEWDISEGFDGPVRHNEHMEEGPYTRTLSTYIRTLFDRSTGNSTTL